MQLQPVINLPAPKRINKVVIADGYNANIITTLNNQFSTAVEQTKAAHFSGYTLQDKGRAIYNYLRNKVNYKKDPDGKQLIQLPARMLGDGGTGKGDCKSLALAAAAFMYNNGFSNVRLRYTSYNATDSTPTHVYAVATDEKGNDIIIDAVYKQYNKEVPYKSKKDYKMQISVLSGILENKPAVVKSGKLTYADRLRRMLTTVRAGGFMFNVISNELARATGTGFSPVRYAPNQISAYRTELNKRAAIIQKPYLKKLLLKEIAVIDSGNFNGNIYSKRSGEAIRGLEDEIGKLSLKKLGRGIKKAAKKISPKNLLKGVKAVALVAPRKSFLLLVALNVRGLATRLSKLSEKDIDTLWNKKLGGKTSVLKSAINRGKKKKPLFGASKKVKAIKGIGVIVDESDTIGKVQFAAAAGGGAAAAGAAAAASNPASGATIATIIAAAAPIVIAFAGLLKKKGIPEVPENAGKISESGNFTDAEGKAAEDRPKLAEWLDKAADIAKATGIIPDKPETLEESKVNQTVKGDDLEADPSAPSAATGKMPILLLAGAAAAGLYIYTKSKRKK